MPPVVGQPKSVGRVVAVIWVLRGGVWGVGWDDIVEMGVGWV